MDYFYHGSIIPGIAQLDARSKLHNSEDKVVYLTDNVPYALYYIWDAEHNGCSIKYVTGWTKNGIAYYEEQFPEQLKTFYQGVSGYLYRISDTANIKAVENRTNMFYSTESVPIFGSIPINDVYEELLKYESEGKFVVLRYNEQSADRQNEFVDFIAQSIIMNGFYADNKEMQEFTMKYFSKAWEKARLQK